MKFVLAVLALVAAVVIIALTPRWAMSAGESTPVERTTVQLETTYQGKGVRWWARRAVQARKDANARGRTIKRLRSAQERASAHFFAWLANSDCVHRRERGADGWETNTGNGYYGGMQADLDFQRAYGPDYLARWGTADKWPWWAQLHMSYRGWLLRGWHPWPNTARACGLL